MPAFLETDRLVLRGFTEADADRLYELRCAMSDGLMPA